MTAPARLAVVYCTDEDIVVAAGADFVQLSAKSPRLAYGVDGYFDLDTPWDLQSPSVDFQAAGVAANMVVLLSKPKPLFQGSGELLAIDAASSTAVTLRWPGMDAGSGQAPGLFVPGPATGVEFTIRTMGPQIEDACFDLNERFGIDPMKPWLDTSRVYDLRVLRRLAVLAVLSRAYTNGERLGIGDWKVKADAYTAEFGDAMTRANIRWGPQGVDPTPNVGWFRTRVGR